MRSRAVVGSQELPPPRIEGVCRVLRRQGVVSRQTAAISKAACAGKGRDASVAWGPKWVHTPGFPAAAPHLLEKEVEAPRHAKQALQATAVSARRTGSQRADIGAQAQRRVPGSREGPARFACTTRPGGRTRLKHGAALHVWVVATVAVKDVVVCCARELVGQETGQGCAGGWACVAAHRHARAHVAGGTG